MSSRILFAGTLMACLLPAGLPGVLPAAHAAPAGQSLLKAGESARDGATEAVIKIKRRGRAPRFPQPLGPAYIYYDYPYYYSRGHYPKHIVEYVYYPPYYFHRRHFSRYGKRHWAHRH